MAVVVCCFDPDRFLALSFEIAAYKKRAVSSLSNYRGVHVTNIIAKIVERAFATVLVHILTGLVHLDVISVAFGKCVLIEMWLFDLCAGGSGH